MQTQTLHIVDLGSNVGRAALGYVDYRGKVGTCPFGREKGRIEAISIGSEARRFMLLCEAESEHRMRKVNEAGGGIYVRKIGAVLPHQGLAELEDGFAHHVHLHMCTGGFSEEDAALLLGGASRILDGNGYFFFSADATFDSRRRGGEGLFGYLKAAIGKQFNVIFAASFNAQKKECDAQGSIMLPQAVGLANSFGKCGEGDAFLRIENPAEFFGRFSSFAQHGEAFFIAAK